MTMRLLEEPMQERGMRLLDDEPQELGLRLVKDAPQKKGMRLIEEEQPEPRGMRLIEDNPPFANGMRLVEEEPGFFGSAYQNTLKPVVDYFGQNEEASNVLIPKEDYQKPQPTDSPQVAMMQLLTKVPDVSRDEFLSEASKLISEGKFFTEEAIERLPVDRDYSRQVLLTGLGEPKQFRRDISFPQALREGYQESATGILSGQGIQDYQTLKERSESELPFLKRQAKNISKVLGDLPAFTVGGLAASLPVGGPETPWGAVLAGSGAFATQTLLESAYNEALRLSDQYPELKGKTLDQIVALVTNPESLKSIGISTLEAGAIGALVAVNPLMKALEKTPLKRFLQVPIARKGAQLATEVTTLTSVPSLIRGKIPSAEDFLDNAVLIGGLKVAGSTAQKLANWAKRGKVLSEDVASRLGEKFTKQDERRLADARTPEEVDTILADVQNRKPGEPAVAKEKVLPVEAKEKAPQAEAAQHPSEQPATVDRIKIGGKEYEVDSYARSLLDQSEELYRDALDNVDNPSYYSSRNSKAHEIEEKAKKHILESSKTAKEPSKQIQEQRARTDIPEPKKLKSEEGKVVLPAERTGLEQPEQAPRLNLVGTETNVPKKSDIIGIFKEAFKDTPIRLGKFPRKQNQSSGFYDIGKNVIRLKESGMIETAAHEFGHKLHMALFGGEGDAKAQLSNVSKALQPYMDELKSISRYSPHDLEGFAEFARMYVTNPKALETLTPSFLKFFESEMTKKSPDVLASLHEARDMYERYLNADPVARTYAHIQSSFDKTLWQKTGDWFSKRFNLDNIKRGLLDELFPIKRAVADTLGIDPVQVENWKSPLNAYVQARVLKGWVGKAEVLLMHETFDANTLKANGKGLKEILEPIKTIGERQELSAYLVAKRAQLLRKRGIKTGLDDATAHNTVAKLKDKYDPIAEELNQYQNRVLEYYRDSGMMSQDTFNKIKALNEFYVPFFRFFEEGEKRIGQRTGGDTGKLQANNQIKRIFGSTREVIDPLESIINNTFAMIQTAEKNRFGQTLAKLTQVNPRGGKYMERVPPKMTKVFEIQRHEIMDAMLAEAKKKDVKVSEVGGDEELVKMVTQIIPESIQRWRADGWGPGENVVTIYQDGKPQYYETTPEIADLYKNSGSQLEGNILIKILNVPARIKRAGAILNPRFIQKNAIRDILGGLIFTKHTGIPILDDVYKPFEGLLSSINKGDLYVDWLKSGGGMATMQSIDKNIVTVKKGLGKGLEKVRPIALMRRIAEVSEEMNRLAEYSKAIEAMGHDRWQKEMAAFQSRDVSIDFAKYGAYTKALNQIIPFWNATVQGGDKLVRTLASKDPEVIQRFMTRVSVGIIMPSLLLQVANDDDKDIAEIDEATKDTNFIFRDPISNEIVQIPVPFETGVLFHGLARRFYNFAVEKDPNAFDGFFGSIIQVATPGFIPAAVEPFLEVWANKDFFRNRHIVHPSKTGLISEEQYGVFTSQTARLIGKAMTYLPGIDAYESSLTSPDIIEHFITSWGAGLGGLALRYSDEALRAIDIQPAIAKPEEGLLDRLGLNAFTKKYPTAKTKSVDEFYETWERWNKLSRSAEAKLEKGDVEGARKLKAEQKALSPVDMKQMAKTMQKSQGAINNVYSNPKMTAEEKGIIIERLYLQQIDMARSFMNGIKRSRKSAE